MKNGFKVMDCDIHVLEPMEIWTEYLDPAFRDQAPTAPPAGTTGWLSVDGRPLPAHSDQPGRMRAMELRYGSERMAKKLEERNEVAAEYSGLDTGTRPETMLGAMEIEGIDVSIVFRTFAAHVIAFDDQDPRFAAALCRAFNRWLHDFCAKDPARLKIGAQIPLHDPALAVEEARFAVEELGAVTLVLPSHMIKGRPLYHPDYEPLWDVADELGTTVSFHGVHASYTEPMLANRYHDNHVMGHATGQPVELMLALGEVITGGVAARHPDARFAFLEGNCSWLPWWLYALDERYEEWGDKERWQQTELPSEIFKRQCWVSMEVDEELACHVVEEVGDDNIVLSTDWPHDDSSFPHAIEEFLGLERISDDTKRKVLWDNCARLYQVEG